jgi:sugar lactone lactonase YvrE
VRAQLDTPRGVAVDGSGNVYIADYKNGRIRRVAAGTGAITTFAGTGGFVATSDSSEATGRAISQPLAVAVDPGGNVFVSTELHQVFRVTPSGAISTVAGSGVPGFAGETGPALAARFQVPNGIAVDGSGNVYVADMFNNRVRRITSAGAISTVAGNGEFSGPTPAGAATSVALPSPSGVALDNSGNLYVSSEALQRVFRVTPNGQISEFAGLGIIGFAGDRGTALNALFNLPAGLAVDSQNRLLIADANNHRIRRVSQVVASNMTRVSGDGQTAVVGTRLAPLTVRVTSPEGTGVAGITVTFAVAAGDIQLDSFTAVTDTEGFASIGARLGMAAGQATVTAVAPGVPTVLFSATAVPEPITALRFEPGSLELVQGATGTARVLGVRASGTVEVDPSTVAWTSLNTEVATVDAAGQITAVAPGTATIRVQALALEADLTVTVVAPPPPPPAETE